MKDEVLKMAAEFEKRFTSMNGIDVPERVSVPRDEWRALNQALKQALAAPVQEPDLIARLKHPEDHYEFSDPKKANAVLMSLCQEAADALADIKQDLTTVQEPAFHGFMDKENCCVHLCYTPWAPRMTDGKFATAYYTTPPAAQPASVQEPASWMEMVVANLVREGVNKHKARELAEHFYGFAQRQWVGLSEEEADKIYKDGSIFGEMMRMVKAKLRSKNNG